MDMVERVARALADFIKSPGFGDAERKEWIDEYWPVYEDQARAAIAAMRDPTDAMVYTAEWEYVNFGKATYLRDLYRTMIDVSLGKREPQSLQGKQFDQNGAVIP